jgi:U2 small nuclear ribonucleoprotein B''
MKRALHLCFTSFGRVLDVVCLKTSKLRGQAWVVFADVPAATNALRGMQGAQFYDRPMVRAPAQLAGKLGVRASRSPSLSLARAAAAPSASPLRAASRTWCPRRTARGCRRTSG